MGVSAGGGPNPQDRYEVRGVDPDEVRSMFIPAWVAEKLPWGALHESGILGVQVAVESKIYEMVTDRFRIVGEDTGERREPVPRWVQFVACDALVESRVPRWVQFVACDALVESRAADMSGRYADVGRVLDAFRDDAGLVDAVRAACMIGGAPAVRQFVVGTFFSEAQGEGA